MLRIVYNSFPVVALEQQRDGEDDAFLGETLSGVFSPDHILSKHVRIVGPQACAVTFVFPHYEKMCDALPHVAIPQINEALFEGLFLVIAHVIRSGSLPISVSREDFRSHRLQAIIREETLRFRTMVLPDTPVELTFSLEGMELRKRFAALTVGIQGFVEGHILFLIPMELLPSPEVSAAQTCSSDACRGVLH